MTSAIDAEVLSMTLEAVERFAADALPEKLLLDLDADEKFPVELVRDLCGETIGIQLLFIPEEYGGMGGGAFDVYRVCEAMARVDLGIATGVLATFLGSDPIRVGGTPEAAFDAARMGGPPVPAHHSPLFKIEPRAAILTGVEAMTVSVLELLGT